MEEELYLKCEGCGEVFEGDEPQVAKRHEVDCEDAYPGYTLVPESEAF